jgi:hypothetical protein
MASVMSNEFVSCAKGLAKLTPSKFKEEFIGHSVGNTGQNYHSSLLHESATKRDLLFLSSFFLPI